MSNSQVSTICQKVKISEYLITRGIELIRTGQRTKCKCPLPSHKDDNTPSFYITVTPDGTELYKCFGCGSGGNIISLIRNMEGMKNGQIINKLAKVLGMKMSPFAADVYVAEPSRDEVISQFCTEDNQCVDLVEYAIEFMNIHGNSRDSVDKISSLYQLLDDLIIKGEEHSISDILDKLHYIINNYVTLNDRSLS